MKRQRLFGLCAGSVVLAALAVGLSHTTPAVPQENAASVFGCWLGDCSIDVSTYQPACNLQVAPSSITPGESAILSWAGNLLSPYLTPLSATVATSGSLSISPNQTTSYILYDHAGVYGPLRYWLYTLFGIPTPVAYCAAVLSVASSPSAPTCLLSAFPQNMLAGGTTTLYYQIAGTVSSSNIQNVGPAPEDLPITYTVSPTATTTYTLSVSGSGGNSKCTTVVGIIPPPSGPYLDIEVSPARIQRGSAVLLAWSAENVRSCAVTDSSGATVGSGLMNPIPAPAFFVSQQEMYTLSCQTAAGATLMQSATVHFVPAVQEI